MGDTEQNNDTVEGSEESGEIIAGRVFHIRGGQQRAHRLDSQAISRRSPHAGPSAKSKRPHQSHRPPQPQGRPDWRRAYIR